MISVDEALEKVLKRIDTLGAEENDVLGCLGQVLAEDVSSPINLPPQDNSAMDGYAVRSADTRGASRKSPRPLRVIETVTAGATPQREVKPGEASRIMTGAPMPKGADAVVKFEDTDESERQGTSKETGNTGETGILVEVKPGSEVRLAGEDISAGSLVLKKGTVIRAAEVGVLASLGRSRVMVIRRPVVAILATGDEIADVTQPLPEGKIYNSNSYGLAALVRRYGGIPKLLGIASDSEDSLRAKLRIGGEADLVITSGGVSLGDYDVVREFLAKEGEIVFWGVRQKPGKPLAFALLKRGRNIPLFALAGNPVSAMINFELFVRPAILKMMGKKNLAKPTVEAIIEDDIKNSDGRRVFSRAIVEKRGGRYFARLTGSQSSGVLTSMALANGLVIVPEDKPGVKRGEVVRVMMLDWSEEIDI